MSSLIVDAFNFLFSCSLLGGLIAILVLAKATPQVPATEGAKYLNGSALTPELVSLNISQLDSPLCRKARLRSFCIVSIVDTLWYTMMLFAVLIHSFRRTRQWRRLAEWRRRKTHDMKSLQTRIRLRAMIGRPLTAAERLAAAAQRAATRPAHPLGDNRNDLYHKHMLARLRCVYYIVARIVCVFSSYFFYRFADNKACPAMAPILWKGGCAVLGSLGFQVVYQSFILGRILEDSENNWWIWDRRDRPPKRFHHREDFLPTATTETISLRPTIPPNITVVSYVPCVAWLKEKLPFPPRVIVDDGTAPNEDDLDGPLCAICFDKFQLPVQAPTVLPLELKSRICLKFWKAGSTTKGTWTADPLWELPCGHHFHEVCAAEWLRACVGPMRCPLCNQNVTRRA